MLYPAKMLRLSVHLILLILFYFALFNEIEACMGPGPHFDFNNRGWEPLERPNNTQGWQKVYLQSTYFFKVLFFFLFQPHK